MSTAISEPTHLPGKDLFAARFSISTLMRRAEAVIDQMQALYDASIKREAELCASLKKAEDRGRELEAKLANFSLTKNL